MTNGKNDLKGMIFGRLKVIEMVPRKLCKRAKWRCVCECGSVCDVDSYKLKSGHTRSCGCIVSTTGLEGERFGRLTVKNKTDKRKDNRIVWLCQCDCGNHMEVTSNALKSGKTRSCGCLSAELSSLRNSTHGMSASREYSAWQGLKNRCNAPNSHSYENYGGRGIKVHPRWQDSFEAFYSDMGECPDGYTIDRINNDGDYEPGNCRWADRNVQQFNRRTPKNSLTGVTGVRQRVDGRWLASLKFRDVHLLYKTFPTFEEALKARTEAEGI